VETVLFAPSAVGAVSDGWVLTATDGSGQHIVGFSGEGISNGGLKGDYYSGASFDSFAFDRLDSTVAFDWSQTTPDPSLVSGQPYSVRWTGQVTPRFSETYTFSFVSQDGVRLWIDGQLLIDQWNGHAPQEDSGDISLTAGQAYDIMIEYYSAGSGGHAELWWTSASQEKHIVPSDAL